MRELTEHHGTWVPFMNIRKEEENQQQKLEAMPLGDLQKSQEKENVKRMLRMRVL